MRGPRNPNDRPSTPQTPRRDQPVPTPHPDVRVPDRRDYPRPERLPEHVEPEPGWPRPPSR